ncbi:MAG: hypothetical protein PVJ33_04140 [Lysobacterales bacterium]|jgi:DnaJ-class molecular chaperone
MNTHRLILSALALLAMSLTGTAQQPADGEQPSSPSPAKRPPIPREITFESSLGNVTFPHRMHMKMGCQTCHHQIHAKHFETPHPAYLSYSWVNCQLCHSEDASISTSYYGCRRCHHSNLANIADETLSAKVVVHKSCWKCHLSGTGAAASERCNFCHVREEQTTPASAGAAPPGGEPAADANSE